MTTETKIATSTATQNPRILSSILFGDFSRYKLVEFQTRFGDVEWQVSDAETVDELTGMPAIIRQCDTREEAIQGLGMVRNNGWVE